MKKFKNTSILILLIAVLAMNSVSVLAANPWPSLSSSNYCEYTATKNINVYKDKECETRGTESPSKKYDAYIEKGDVCFIYKITSKYTKVNYPTSNGRRTGYAKTKDVFAVKNPLLSYAGHDDGFTVYVSPGGKKYGCTYPYDGIYVVEQKDKYYSIIYEAKSGKRGYKFGWIKYSGWFWEPPASGK